MAVSSSPFMLRVVFNAVRRIFPKVEHLDTDTLVRWMKDEDKDNLVLLDVREEYEYKVSHLAKALSINPEAPAHEVVAQINEKAKGFRGNVDVVAYCAVGMRASTMAQRINDELERTKEVEGHKIRVPMKVYNLEGSMFKWTNEGKPLVDYQGHETQYCHPVSYFWGLLIPENKRKY